MLLTIKKRGELLAVLALTVFGVIASAGYSFGGANDLTCGSSGCTAGTANGVAAGAVGTAGLADNAVTSAKIDITTVQSRVSGTCASGSSIRSIDASG